MRQLAREVRGGQPAMSIEEHIRATHGQRRDVGLPEAPEARLGLHHPSARNATHGEPSRWHEASYEATEDGRLRMIRVERHEEVRPGIWR